MKTIAKLGKAKYLIAALVLLVGSCSLAIALSYKTITIIDGDDTYTVNTFKSTAGQLLEEQAIVVAPHDRLSKTNEEKLSRKDKIAIERAKLITIEADGQIKSFYTLVDTVAQALDEAGVEVREQDILSHNLTKELANHDQIVISRVDSEIITKVETIDFSRVVNRNQSLETGIVREIQKGKSGEKEISIKITYKDGEEVSREVVGEKVLREAVAQIIEEGTRNFIVTSRGETRTFKKVIYMTATAYHAGFESTGKNPGDPYYGMTRSGTRVRPGVVAVDPRVIALGTNLFIESLDGWPDYGVAFAEDTGGAIKGNKIDLYFEDPETVKKFGRRQVKVYVLD